jgi:hypothetical protein
MANAAHSCQAYPSLRNQVAGPSTSALESELSSFNMSTNAAPYTQSIKSSGPTDHFSIYGYRHARGFSEGAKHTV